MEYFKFNQKAPDFDKSPYDLEYVINQYKTGGYSDALQSLISSGCIMSGGWCFNFTMDLRHFVFKQYGQWSEGYAPNKTLLRKAVHGRIDKIVEIKN
jgi:hypothetical protein